MDSERVMLSDRGEDASPIGRRLLNKPVDATQVDSSCLVFVSRLVIELVAQ